MRRARVPLAEPYQPIAIVESVDQRRGRVRYAFRGPRAHGVLVIAPSTTPGQALPTDVRVQLGDDAPGLSENQRPNRPVVNGVPLVGGLIVDPAEFLARDRHRLSFHRPTGPYTSCSTPDATSRYTAAIVLALLRRWHDRPDRDELIRAAGGVVAAGRLNELYRTSIARKRERIEQLQQELAADLRLAAELCQLAGEHHDRQAREKAETTAAASAGAEQGAPDD